MIISTNLRNYLNRKVWGLKARFELLGHKTVKKPYVQNPSSSFHKKASFSSEL